MFTDVENRKFVKSVYFSIYKSHKFIKNPTTIIKIESTREFKSSDKPEEIATQYYISRLKDSTESFQKATRSYWTIENKLHCTSNVAFSEDTTRKRIVNSAQNFFMIP